MIEILDETPKSLTIRHEPKVGSLWNRYSYGDTIWRLHARVLADVAANFDIVEGDIGILMVVSGIVDPAKLAVHADWKVLEERAEVHGAYWSVRDGETCLLPHHLESTDDAACFLAANQLPSKSFVFRGRTGLFKRLAVDANPINALGLGQLSAFLGIESSGAGDSLNVSLAGSESDILRSRIYIDSALSKIGELVV